MIHIIQLRLVAETEADCLAAALELLTGVGGSSRIAISAPHEGRRGQWLAYGTLQIAAENSAYAAERAAATGETTRLRKR